MGDTWRESCYIYKTIGLYQKTTVRTSNGFDLARHLSLYRIDILGYFFRWSRCLWVACSRAIALAHLNAFLSLPGEAKQCVGHHPFAIE